MEGGPAGRNVDLLRAIGEHTLSGLTAASHVLLGNNQINSVHVDALTHSSDTLLVLDLSRNLLTSSPAALSTLRVLQTLDLSQNSIPSIADASFLNNMSAIHLLIVKMVGVEHTIIIFFYTDLETTNHVF